MIVFFRNSLAPVMLLCTVLIIGCDEDTPAVDTYQEDVPEEETDDTIQTDYDYSEDTTDYEASTTDYETDTSEDSEENVYTQASQSSGNTEMWRIILSSMPSDRQAQDFVQKHDLDAEVKYVPDLNTYRVVYGSYANLQEAQQSYSGIRGRFPEAWMIKF